MEQIPNFEQRVQRIIQTAKQNIVKLKELKWEVIDTQPNNSDSERVIQHIKSLFTINQIYSEKTPQEMMDECESASITQQEFSGIECAIAWLALIFKRDEFRYVPGAAEKLVTEWFFLKRLVIGFIGKYMYGCYNEVIPGETFVSMPKELYAPLKPLIEEHFSQWDTALTVVPNYPFEDIEYVKTHVGETMATLGAVQEAIHEMELICESIENSFIHKAVPNQAFEEDIKYGLNKLQKRVAKEEANGILSHLKFPTDPTKG